MHPAELIRKKRDGGRLNAADIAAFVQGLYREDAQRWSEGQVAAMAMATLLRGMQRGETTALTQAMAQSGERLDWASLRGRGPLLDKHSTGGVGDKVSLLLAPLVAACGGIVPMLSGRGLGHTGGTLDKLAAIPGYQIEPSPARRLATLKSAGCAIFGANARIAPADKRLYAVRDITATVESVPLITASILSKKLAAGVQGLVLDVKLGQGAFCQTLEQAQALSRSLVAVARQAGLAASAVLSDMNQVLGHSAGNALEVQECIDFFTGTRREPRLLRLTLELAARMLVLGALAKDKASAMSQAKAALDSGAAALRFEAMVAGLGGPRRLLQHGAAGLAAAPVQRDWLAPRSGELCAMDTRAIGMLVVALGGGRRRAEDAVDPRVGFSHFLPLGQRVQKGEPVVRVHAASAADAQAALAGLAHALRIGAPGSYQACPLIR